MRSYSLLHRVFICLALTLGVVGLSLSAASGQSQEPKPGVEVATPASTETTSANPELETGLGANDWQSPIWGLRVNWDPAVWTVESELIESRYEGLQLGSGASTVYIEAFEGFEGSAKECLAAAEQEIAERTNTREVTRLAERPLPEGPSNNVESALFGIIADLPDGSIYRGAEYVACRPLQPGVAVLETTWQTSTATYNDELPAVSEILASMTIPDDVDT